MKPKNTDNPMIPFLVILSLLILSGIFSVINDDQKQ